MASTATDRLGFEKPATGDDYNTWGTTLNNLFDMLDVAIAGNVSLTISGSNYTLTDTDYLATSEALNIGYIVGTSDAARSVIIPSEEKFFFVDNKSSYVILFKTSGGTGTVVLPGTRASCYCDGTECYRISTSGWGLASSTSASGASVAIDTRVTGEEFTDALIVVNDVSASGVANLLITEAGNAGTITISSVFSGGATIATGGIKFENCRATEGIGYAYCTGGTGLESTANYYPLKWSTAAITTVTFAPSAGTFDAGTFDLYLR